MSQVCSILEKPSGVCLAIKCSKLQNSRESHDKVQCDKPDFMPLFFIRATMQKAGLLQRRKVKLLPTNSGRELIAQGQQGSLQATLFYIACW